MIVFALFLIFLASPVGAATYYVATTGSDSNNGSSDLPWRNPQKCVAAGSPLVAGDTCLVRSGTYTYSSGSAVLVASGSTSPQGTSSNPITIKSEVLGGAIISIPTNLTVSSGRGFVIARNYYTIEGFQFTGGASTDPNISITGVLNTGLGLVLRRNYFHNIGKTMCTNSNFSTSAISLQTQGNILIEYNYFYNIGRRRNGEAGCSTSHFQHDHGVYSQVIPNVTVRHNLFRDVIMGYPLHFYKSGGAALSHVNPRIYNNTFVGKSPTGLPAGQLIFCNTVSGGIVRNNIFSDTPSGYGINYCSGTVAVSTTITHNLSDTTQANIQNPTSKPASGITYNNNTLNTSPGFTNAGSADFTLASGSAAINAGVNVGLAYNDSAPDIGAFETITFSACEVPDGESTTIRATFVNNTNPPLLPASSVTGVTGRKNAVSNTITASARVGDNQIDFTMTNSYAGGDTADLSATSTNITDSALIGGTLNQPWVGTLTNQSCTNNIAGVSYTFTQAATEFRYALGSEAAPVILPYGKTSAENFSWLKIRPGGKVRMRFSVVCDGGCPDTAFYLYSDSGSGHELVPDTFSTQDVAFCGIDLTDIPANGAPTTDQLSTSGTFRAGGIVFTANAIPTVTGLLDTNKTELEYCVKFDTDATGTKTFRLGKQDGGTLTYTNNASVVITPDAAGGAGF